jgi:hypothetical protein
VPTGAEPGVTADWRAALTDRWVRRWPGVLPVGHDLPRSLHDHPYDGGADVIAPTPGERETLRDRHRDRLSADSSGL